MQIIPEISLLNGQTGPAKCPDWEGWNAGIPGEQLVTEGELPAQYLFSIV